MDGLDGKPARRSSVFGLYIDLRCLYKSVLYPFLAGLVSVHRYWRDGTLGWLSVKSESGTWPRVQATAGATSDCATRAQKETGI